jgi:anti-anti-sigma regulatory factor
MNVPETAGVVCSEGETAVVFAGDYLNKLTGENIERECRNKLAAGCRQIVVNFSRTEMVNSIGVSILLGVIDSAKIYGASVVFSDLNEDTVELLDMLGVTKHVSLTGEAVAVN